MAGLQLGGAPSFAFLFVHPSAPPVADIRVRWLQQAAPIA